MGPLTGLTQQRTSTQIGRQEMAGDGRRLYATTAAAGKATAAKPRETQRLSLAVQSKQEMDQSRMSSVSKERKRDQRKRQNTFCFKSE